MEQDNSIYIQLVRKITVDDTENRYSVVNEGSYGAVLNDEKDIKSVLDLSPFQMERYIEKLKYAKKNNKVLALVEGYICALSKGDYIVLDKKVFVPWEIIV